MKFEFKVHKLKQGSKGYDQLVTTRNDKNEFIIVGEDLELNLFCVHQLDNKGILLIGDLPIDECAYLVNKDDLELSHDDISCEIVELDIPKRNLTLDTVDSIKRLNEI